MKRFLASFVLAAAAIVSAAPAQAQMMNGMPVYNSWQMQWNHGRYDHRHVVLGQVVSFSPYRLTVQRNNGRTQTVDLKNGTVIRPMGATPQPGQRIAMIGYYSGGTFIVNRLVLRR